jgi:hypothetical protein
MLCERCNAEIEHGRDRLPTEYFDTAERAVWNGAIWQPLSPRPWQVLTILWHHSRRRGYTSVESLLTLMYSDPYDIDEPDTAGECLKVYITRVRKVLRGSPYTIINRTSVGYRLVENGLGTHPEIGPIEPSDGPQPDFLGKYPFNLMRSGQSFLVRNGDYHVIRAAVRRRPLCGSFAVLREPGGIRVEKITD